MSAKKDAPLAFRIPAELKRDLLNIAGQEERSISQVCELFLRIGTEQYQKEGAKFLQKHLNRRNAGS
jgi:hypothetical protein